VRTSICATLVGGSFALAVACGATDGGDPVACGDDCVDDAAASAPDGSIAEGGPLDANAPDGDGIDGSVQDAFGGDAALDGDAGCSEPSHHYLDVVVGYDDDLCALDDQGAVRCVGAGWVEDSTSHVVSMVQNAFPQPTVLPNLGSGIVELRAGTQFMCALASNGAVFCWGKNDIGQLGDPTFTGAARATPTAVQGLGNVTHLSVGSLHACALLDTQKVMCWGGNGNLALLGSHLVPTGAQTYSATPVEVDNVSGAVQLEASADESCARLGTGGLACWGWSALVPAAGVGANITDFALGTYGGCAKTTASALTCWGEARAGTYTAPNLANAQEVPGLTGAFKAFEVRDYGACAIMSAGGVKCWGLYFGGRTPATDYLTTPAVPVDVPALGTDVSAVRVNLASATESYDVATSRFLDVSTDHGTGHTENQPASIKLFESTRCGVSTTATGFHVWARKNFARVIVDEHDDIARAN
jgi:hypothetical protein